MIYIEQDKSNRIVSRFFDRRQRTDTFFIWEVINPITKKIVKFITTDTSTRPQSYNIFEFNHTSIFPITYDYLEGESEVYEFIVSPLAPDVSLTSGHNEYRVFETTDFSLDPQYIIGEIESDIMFVEIIRDVNTANSQSENIYY